MAKQNEKRSTANNESAIISLVEKGASPVLKRYGKINTNAGPIKVLHNHKIGISGGINFCEYLVGFVSVLLFDFFSIAVISSHK